jgi:hypothetical protein
MGFPPLAAKKISLRRKPRAFVRVGFTPIVPAQCGFLPFFFRIHIFHNSKIMIK